MSNNAGIDLVDTVNTGCLDIFSRIPLGMLFIALGCYLGVSATVFSETAVQWWQYRQPLDFEGIFHEVFRAPQIVLTSVWGLILAPLCYFTVTYFTHSLNNKTVWAYTIIALWACITAFAKLDTSLCPYWVLAVVLPFWLAPSALLSRYLYRREVEAHLEHLNSIELETKRLRKELIEEIQDKAKNVSPLPAPKDDNPEVPVPLANQDYTLKLEQSNKTTSQSPTLQKYQHKKAPKQKTPQAASTSKGKVKVTLNPITKAAILLASNESTQAKRPTVPKPEDSSSTDT